MHARVLFMLSTFKVCVLLFCGFFIAYIIHIHYMICNRMHQNVECFQPGTDGDPVYSYTRQQLTAKTIQNLAPALYEKLHSLQKKVSLAFAGLTPTEDDVLMTKYPECFEFSVLAAIPSIGGIPK